VPQVCVRGGLGVAFRLSLLGLLGSARGNKKRLLLSRRLLIRSIYLVLLLQYGSVYRAFYSGALYAALFCSAI
jgi:hypothetical protein